MTDTFCTHPRTYSLVGAGGPDKYLVTDDESGINIGYARKVGGPITAPSRGLDVDLLAEALDVADVYGLGYPAPYAIAVEYDRLAGKK